MGRTLTLDDVQRVARSMEAADLQAKMSGGEVREGKKLEILRRINSPRSVVVVVELGILLVIRTAQL